LVAKSSQAGVNVDGLAYPMLHLWPTAAR
jgi:hypothetical protein